MCNILSNYICMDSWFHRQIILNTDSKSDGGASCQSAISCFIFHSRYMYNILYNVCVEMILVLLVCRFNFLDESYNESISRSNNCRCRHAQLDVNDFLGSRLISIVAR